MDILSRIAVIGEGSWGTALVKLLQNNVSSLNWYIREPAILDYIRKNHHNPEFSSSIELGVSGLNLFNNASEAIRNSDIIIFAVPSAFLKIILDSVTPENLTGKFIVSAIKGLVPEENMTVCEFFHNLYYVPENFLGIISGPSHAEEVALERLTYLTISAKNPEDAEFISGLISCRYIKTSVSDDIYGTEYATALKNIMALASGICHGLGYGDNFQAVLISNAIQEIQRFVDKVHPLTRDIKDYVYLGDLLVTAYSQFSRNRTFGTMLGKGYCVNSARLEMNMVAEGYYAVKSIMEINKKYDVEMPITQAVYNILYQRYSPAMEIKLLIDKLR
jgi:glycerol-3-phosphate dehydrogenase (NAD(P)+)